MQVFRVLVGVLLTSVVGCGRPELQPVAGRVTIGGVPADNVSVRFQLTSGKSTEGRQLGIGITDAAGRFVVTSGSGAAGLEPGTYRVYFSRTMVDGKAVSPQKRSDRLVESVKPPHNDPLLSPIVVTIPQFGDFQFDLPG